MNFVEAIRARRAIRRKGKASHCGSNGTGWVDPFFLITCCKNTLALDPFQCGVPHLHVDDILADDWEVYPESETTQHVTSPEDK